MIDVERAFELIGGAVASLGDEHVPLAAAAGRVLREPVVADRDVPPTDRSAMDGYAVRAADLAGGEATLSLVGELRAGQPAGETRVEPGTTVRIMTGAVVPPGADAVVMVERSEESADGRRVTLRDTPQPGANVRRRGEDVLAGAALLEPGRRIRPAEIAALASVGVDPVRVARRARATVLSTGDELVPATEQPGPHQVRNSNAPMLVAALERHGATVGRSATVADEPAALEEAVERGLADDLLLLSGGVSVGRYDLVADTLERAGVRTLFHGVAVKPGKPVLAGVGPARGAAPGCLVLGLPGNPVSAFACFVLFGASALRRMAGIDPWRPVETTATLASPLRARPGRRTYHLASLEHRPAGVLAHPVRTSGSGDALALARANGFVVTDERCEGLGNGVEVAVLSWDVGPGSSSYD